MQTTLETVAAEALKLPVKDRAALAHTLLCILDEDSPDDPAEVQRAWEETIEARVSDVLAGRVEGIPADEVFAKLRAKHG
jgi:putative addiction module component (TIGR02574 family)